MKINPSLIGDGDITNDKIDSVSWNKVINCPVTIYKFTLSRDNGDLKYHLNLSSLIGGNGAGILIADEGFNLCQAVWAFAGCSWNYCRTDFPATVVQELAKSKNYGNTTSLGFEVYSGSDRQAITGGAGAVIDVTIISFSR